MPDGQAVVGVGQAERGNRFACHDASGAFRQRHARGLRDEGHRAARAGVHLDDVDAAVFDRVLDVHQTLRAHGQGELARVRAQGVEHLIGEREGRRAAGRIARMYARLLDVLQNRADVNVRAVAQGIHVAFRSRL